MNRNITITDEELDIILNILHKEFIYKSLSIDKLERIGAYNIASIYDKLYSYANQENSEN